MFTESDGTNRRDKRRTIMAYKLTVRFDRVLKHWTWEIALHRPDGTKETYMWGRNHTSEKSAREYGERMLRYC